MNDKSIDCTDALFISMGGIGNLVLLTPAIRDFCDVYPAMRLHFLLPPNGSRQIIECHPQTGSVIETLPSLRSFPALLLKIRKLHPQIVIASNGTNPLKCGLIGLLGGAHIRCGEQSGMQSLLYTVTVPFDPKLHECSANRRLVSRITGIAGTAMPYVWTTESDRIAAHQFSVLHKLGEPWIGMHLGSGLAMTYKRWPTERFIDVGKQLQQLFSCRIVIFGGADEKAMVQHSAEQIGNNVIAAAGQLTIRQSYEVMKLCRVFISNDSGPMHLAAASGAPVVAIFGPTLDYKTSPVGDRTVVVTSPVACRPCYAFKPVLCSNRKCLDEIIVKQVVDAACRIGRW